MTLTLLIVGKEIALILAKEGKILGQKKWTDKNDLSEKFFPQADTLLKENNYTMKDIENFLLENNIPEGYTTARIAKTIMDSLRYAREESKK